MRDFDICDWNIAIADYSDDFIPRNIKWLKHSYKDRWFADPFIISETENTYTILVEEMILANNKGRIARLTVTKDECKLLSNETILELPSHLSYPHPIQIDGDIYIYPENGASGHTKYYKYGKALSEAGLLSELPLSDATIFKNGEGYYMFYTIGESCNGNILHVSFSKEPLSNYQSEQTITFESNIARRAGHFFEYNGEIISPAQDCNGGYGIGISIQRCEINDGHVSMKEIKRIPPASKYYSNGFHTFNVFGNKVVIDGYRYKHKYFHKFYKIIRLLNKR